MSQTLSTSQVARLLGVAVGSVANWIDQGQIKAGKTPGGHRRIETRDLLEFLRQQKLPIPPELIAPPKVLVVDDEQAVARMIADEIQTNWPDCQVLTAFDGFSAGEIVGSLRPGVVLLDLKMPGMDGYQVCRKIKTAPATQDTVVIAMTAYPSARAQKEILECGARVCLAKPLNTAALRRELEPMLGRIAHAASAASGVHK